MGRDVLHQSGLVAALVSIRALPCGRCGALRSVTHG